MIKALLFDKDGTLFDFGATWETWAESFLLRLCNGDRSEAASIGQILGFDLATSRFDPGSVVIAGTPEDIAKALEKPLKNKALSAEYVIGLLNEEAAHTPQVEAVELVPYLDHLRSHGLKLGVATNDAEAPALAHLGAAGVVGKFDFIAGFDSGHGAKPGPGQLLAFCDAVNLVPEQVAMVGDSTHDLIAGAAAGMRRVAVLTGMATRADLTPYADIVLPDIGHIPAWLGL
ncbi:MAG: phosphatase [Rhodobacterales bacterium]|nr:MAG: phosphatase [Rhodobacterales bacterium]